MRSSVIIDQHRRKEVRAHEMAVRDRKALCEHTFLKNTTVELIPQNNRIRGQSLNSLSPSETKSQKLGIVQRNRTVLQTKFEAQKRSAKVSLAMLRPRSTQVRRRCVATGRGRGVLRRFRLSRIKVRESVLRGELACARKRTW